MKKGFRIGGWDTDPQQLVITREGAQIRLEPEAMAVLVCLAEHSGDVVARDGFPEAVWKGGIVSDEVLSQNISVLRSQLGDDDLEPRFIETIEDEGYRMIMRVELPASVESQRLWIKVVGVMLVVIALIVFWT
ncbi:MAG: winged helix-turn-helix domain-containing protein [Gammaproteobacteria bacterium]|nr:winged helix-turn-helix domain-containing protein [Gammaproteobacteria bacterium]